MRIVRKKYYKGIPFGKWFAGFVLVVGLPDASYTR